MPHQGFLQVSNERMMRLSRPPIERPVKPVKANYQSGVKLSKLQRKNRKTDTEGKDTCPEKLTPTSLAYANFRSYGIFSSRVAWPTKRSSRIMRSGSDLSSCFSCRWRVRSRVYSNAVRSRCKFSPLAIQIRQAYFKCEDGLWRWSRCDFASSASRIVSLPHFLVSRVVNSVEYWLCLT